MDNLTAKTRTPEQNLQAAWDMPLDQIDVSDGYLFRDNSIGEYFKRLRREDPVHYCSESRFGSFWSITRFKDIRRVELDHETFSSEQANGGITLASPMAKLQLPSFIAMDQPKHDHQRKTVNSVAMPENLSRLEATIRERVIDIIENLPVGEEFNWVEKVSVELTTRMLATLFDFPYEERHLLTYWSDIATGHTNDDGPVTSSDMQVEELRKCFEYFGKLWDERIKREPGADLISMMAHSAATKQMPRDEFAGNLLLLIVGGNDTTRNSISGGLLALNEHPKEYEKLRANPELIASLVPEIIRWQTPLAHMARTALSDAQVNGKTIRKGDRVAMWYLSANRDDEVINDPDQFIIDRKNPRQHLAFGFGIHHCMGSRLAELQLKLLWEELLKRYPNVEVTGTPERSLSNFVHGFTNLPVTLRN